MIFEIKQIVKSVAAMASGKFIHWTPDDRRPDDASRGLTPAEVDRIMVAANSGNPSELFRLAAELPEKNWDIFHALETRRNAVLGCEWSIEPGDDSTAAKTAAEALEKELCECGSELDEIDSFYDLRCDMSRALLPGVCVSEIIWEPGGSLTGFSFIEPHHLDFRSGRIPKLITINNPLGVELQRGKYVMHLLRTHGTDPVRGGLIRPLAWLHCFANLNLKDLLRFIERYGMPFTVARVDQNTWENERAKLKSLIRSFGPDGGGVFTKATEIQLLQAANNTGDVYFRLLEYIGAAITKVVLGQTATSGDAAGFSKGGAQSDVRQDIKDADCRWIENTFNSQVSKPWSKFNSGDAAPVPRLKIHSEPESDEKAEADRQKTNADTVKVLTEANYELDDAEVSEKTGFKVTKKAAPAPAAVALPVTIHQPPVTSSPDLTALELPATAPVAQTALAAWLGPFADAINELSDDESGDKQFAAKLAAMSSADSLEKFDSKTAADVLTVQAAESMKAAVDKVTRQTKGAK